MPLELPCGSGAAISKPQHSDPQVATAVSKLERGKDGLR